MKKRTRIIPRQRWSVTRMVLHAKEDGMLDQFSRIEISVGGKHKKLTDGLDSLTLSQGGISWKGKKPLVKWNRLAELLEKEATKSPMKKRV